MAKSLCQQFQNCRLIENAVDPQNKTFRDKGIWYLTPKGLCILQDFCVRTEVDLATLRKHFTHMEVIHLVHLERNIDNDQLVLNLATASIIFRVMMTNLPLDGELPAASHTNASSNSSWSSNTSSSASSAVSTGTSSSSHSINAPFAMSASVTHGDSRVHMLSNYLLTLSKSSSRMNQPKTAKTMRTTFSSQMCCDWLLDFTTVSCREEAETITQEFVKHGWLEFQDSKHYTLPLKSSKATVFVVTEKGKQAVSDSIKQATAAITVNQPAVPERIKHGGLVRSRSNTLEKPDEKTTLQEILNEDTNKVIVTTERQDDDSDTTSIADSHTQDTKESNSARLKIILENAKLRSPFKDFLRANFCEENLDFWIDYNNLKRKCTNQSPALPSKYQQGLLEDAYDIWSTYLAPGSSCELNVEHSLCQEMARIVQSVVTVIPAYNNQGSPTIVVTAASASQSLRLILKLFDRVNDHICRLMASDSVPKFVKTEKYRRIIDSIERNERKKQKELKDLTDSLRNMETVSDTESAKTEAS